MTGNPRYVNVCIWYLKVNAVLDLIGSDKLVKGKNTLHSISIPLRGISPGVHTTDKDAPRVDKTLDSDQQSH